MSFSRRTLSFLSYFLATSTRDTLISCQVSNCDDAGLEIYYELQIPVTTVGLDFEPVEPVTDNDLMV